MMSKADTYHDAIMELCSAVKDPELTDRNEVESFIRALTKLTFDYCMFGMLYDYYTMDAEVLKENAVRLKGADDIVMDRQTLLAAFPGLKTQIEHIIISSDNKGGWRVFRRMYLTGTKNSGDAGDTSEAEVKIKNLALSMMYLSKIDGRWKITYEMDMHKAF